MKFAILACVVLFAALSNAFPSPLTDSDNGSGADATNAARRCTPKQAVRDKCHDPKSLPKTGDDESTVRWFKDCIVNYYCFVEAKTKIVEWEKQPNFEGKINTVHFNRAAEVAKNFFLGKTWKGPQGLVPKYSTKGTKEKRKLLHITAARYLYVTSLLFKASEDGIQACRKGDGGKVRVPDSVCFMEPVGSATSTSDYDASLVGGQSGLVTARFNEMFEKIFHMPSEEVLDTNIYAFSLEYAMPYIYDGLSDDFIKNLQQMEADDKYKIQDLVCALYKIRKYDFADENDKKSKGVEYTQLKKAFTEKFNAKDQKLFASWDWTLNAWDEIFKIKGNSRNEHNEIYSNLVSEISREALNEFAATYLTQVMVATMYAAEAYHSRGAMRYVVGWTQLQNQEVKSKLTPLDYWASMMENWGDTLKEYSHCKAKSEVCLVKMSKYMTRTFNSMIEIRKALAVTDLKDLSPAAELTYNWLQDVKKLGKPSIEAEKEIGKFFLLFACKDDKKGSEISRGCIDKIFSVIRSYHYKLIESMNKGKI